MADLMDLPDGLVARAPTEGDIDDIVSMVNRCERIDIGEVMLERADVVSDIGHDAFDRQLDQIAVFRNTAPVAWAILLETRITWIDVDPDARGQGVGASLRRWSEVRAREKGHDWVGQIVPDRRADVATALRAAGYRERHTSWIFEIEHTEEPARPAPPDGITLRPATAPDEGDTFDMFERAFAEFHDRLPSSRSTWRAMTVGREGFVPDDLIIAVEGDRVVGGAFLVDADEIWVDKLAVDRRYRHRGVGRALLQTAFRRSYERGYSRTRLSTDSRTDAPGFYERAGMTIHSTFTNLALDLSVRPQATS